MPTWMRRRMSVIGGKNRRGADMPPCPLLTDSVKKRFYGLERATLIQNRSRVRNFDSNSSLFGFDCCVLAAPRGLYQHYRPLSDIFQGPSAERENHRLASQRASSWN